MKTISRKEAKKQGLNRYFTGKPCKHGHVSERYTKNCSCVACSNEYHKAYCKANREKVNAVSKKYRDNNKEKLKAIFKTYYSKNREKLLAKSNRYREKNKERVSKYNKNYSEINKKKLKEKFSLYYKENKERIDKRSKTYSKENRGRINFLKKNQIKFLSDSYIKQLIKDQFNIPIDKITTELVERKREQLKQFRLQRAITTKKGARNGKNI